MNLKRVHIAISQLTDAFLEMLMLAKENQEKWNIQKVHCIDNALKRNDREKRSEVMLGSKKKRGKGSIEKSGRNGILG